MRLVDMNNVDEQVSLFLFGTAYDKYWKLTVSTAIGLMNPSIMKNDKVGSACYYWLKLIGIPQAEDNSGQVRASRCLHNHFKWICGLGCIMYFCILLLIIASVTLAFHSASFAFHRYFSYAYYQFFYSLLANILTITTMYVLFVCIITSNIILQTNARNSATINIHSESQLLVIGTSKDFAMCGSVTKNGNRCTNIVNKAQCDKCRFHALQEHKAKRQSRAELNTT